MVGAINPNASTPIAQQQRLARDSAYMLNPGEPFPLESPSPSPSATLGSSATPQPSKSREKHELSAGVIAGIVVAVVVVILLGILIFLINRRGRTPAEKSDRLPDYGHHASTIHSPVSPNTHLPHFQSPQEIDGNPVVNKQYR
jgi:hypothetical protein